MASNQETNRNSQTQLSVHLVTRKQCSLPAGTKKKKKNSPWNYFAADICTRRRLSKCQKLSYAKVMWISAVRPLTHLFALVTMQFPAGEISMEGEYCRPTMQSVPTPLARAARHSGPGDETHLVTCRCKT